MDMRDIPFGTTDWSAILPTTHPGETGVAVSLDPAVLAEFARDAVLTSTGLAPFPLYLREPDAVPAVVAEFGAVIGRALGRDLKPHPVERQAFYDEAKRAYAIVRTGERRFYGNIVLTKGVVDAGGRPGRPGG